VPCFKICRKSSPARGITLGENENQKEDVKVLTKKNPDGSITTTTTTVRVTKTSKNGTAAAVGGGGRTDPVRLSDIIGNKKPSPTVTPKGSVTKKPTPPILLKSGNLSKHGESTEIPRNKWIGAGKPSGAEGVRTGISKNNIPAGVQAPSPTVETVKEEGKKLFGAAIGKNSKFKEIGKERVSVMLFFENFH